MSSPNTASPLQTASLRRGLAAWFREKGRDLPWRRTRDPYAIMVSEFMLQQTQVATVVGYFERWVRRFPDFATLASASEADVLHVWQGLGYYSRARNLHRAAQQVVLQHGGKMPRRLEVIAALPGIGRYTAAAIASFAFDRAVPAVDANIARVLARLFDMREPIDSTRGSAAIWDLAAQLLPARGGRLHTSAIMELGALVCTPRKPQCSSCPVLTYCRTTSPQSLPVKRPRRKTVTLTEDCAWIVQDGCVLLEQQTGSRWRGLWKLPPLPASSSLRDRMLVELEYPFTHHRVTLRVFASEPPPRLDGALSWFRLNPFEAASPSPHRRAIEVLTGMEPVNTFAG